MKKDLINNMTDTFEAHAQETEGGIEFWLARDLQHLLGYAKWDNFLNAVSKAKTACEVSDHTIKDHFADVGKMVDLGSGSQREVDDIMLTRFACYLIAQNGDPRKQEIAFAPTIILKAKDFAAEITIFNAKERQLGSESAVSQEHIFNNQAVRDTLLSRGIRPENLPADEDIIKVERRLTSEQRKSLKNLDGLD